MKTSINAERRHDMPSDAIIGGGQEYLVAARSAGLDGARDLQAAMAQIQQMAGAAILQASGAPPRLVVRMTPQQASALLAAFGGRLIVEPNAELRY
jgi:hypothetical protein